MWNESVRSDRLIRAANPFAEENKTSELLVIRNRGPIERIGHAETTR